MKTFTKKSKIALIFGIILVVLALLVASIVVFDSKAEIIEVQNNGTQVNASIIFRLSSLSSKSLDSIRNF